MPASSSSEDRLHPYGLREVQKLLGLSRATIRALVTAGFAAPSRGPRNAWRFSFQDLIALRTAQALAAGSIPARRIARSMKELRRRLPESMPLSGLSIAAEADRVVVKEGASRWQADSGQYLLALEVRASNGALHVIERPQPGAGDLLDRAAALEQANDVAAALDAYDRALKLDPSLVDAHINRGRLLHDAGRLDEAERAYREAIEACGEDALLCFNLGVLLEDRGRRADAVRCYQAALRADASLADCHYNLALAYEASGKPRDALRHMAQYRRLSRRR